MVQVLSDSRRLPSLSLCTPGPHSSPRRGGGVLVVFTTFARSSIVVVMCTVVCTHANPCYSITTWDHRDDILITIIRSCLVHRPYVSPRVLQYYLPHLWWSSDRYAQSQPTLCAHDTIPLHRVSGALISLVHKGWPTYVVSLRCNRVKIANKIPLSDSSPQSSMHHPTTSHPLPTGVTASYTVPDCQRRAVQYTSSDEQ